MSSSLQSQLITRKPFYIAGLLFFLCVLTSGCAFRQKALDNISRQYQYLDKYKGEVKDGTHTKRLNWKEAKALLIKNNVSLQRSRRAVKQAEDRRKKNWRNYIPGIQGSASLSQRLANFSQISLDSINFSAFLRLRVPNPLTFSGEVQALNLAEYTAQQRYILQERQMVLRLYQTFLKYYSVQRQLERIDKNQQQNLVNSQAIIGAIKSSTSKERNVKSLETQLKATSISIADMIELQGKELIPNYESLPELGYRNSKRDYLSDQEYGKLAITMQAANLESARLRMRSVKLSRFPSLNFSASAPQLYSSNSGNSSTFDPEAISLFGGVSEGVDWTRREQDQVTFSKEDYHYAVKSAQSKIRSDKERLKNTQKQMLQMNKELKTLRNNRETLADLIRENLSPKFVTSSLEQIINLDEQIDRLEFQIRYQELQFWVWDERKW